MVIKYTSIFHCKILRNYPNWYFWFENMPAGNLAVERNRDFFSFIFSSLFRRAKAVSRQKRLS
jgi:hypothetical protein